MMKLAPMRDFPDDQENDDKDAQPSDKHKDAAQEIVLAAKEKRLPQHHELLPAKYEIVPCVCYSDLVSACRKVLINDSPSLDEVLEGSGLYPINEALVGHVDPLLRQVDILKLILNIAIPSNIFITNRKHLTAFQIE